MFQTKIVVKFKTYILCSITFFLFRKSYRLWDSVRKEWYSWTGHRWQYAGWLDGASSSPDLSLPPRYTENLLSSSLLSKNTTIKIYRTIILLVVLYGCETWSLTLREERRLRVSENRVLRRIFWPKRDEVKGEWRKLRNEEINDLYCSPNIVRVIKSIRMRWVRHVARMGERRGVYRVLVGEQTTWKTQA